MHWRLSRLKVWTPARTGNGLRRSGGLCSGVRMSRRQVPSAKHRRGRSVRRMQGGRRGPSTGTASRGLSWLLPSTARSLRILLRTSLDDRRRIRSDRAVLRLPGSRLVASLAGLAARAMRALWNACRPTSVAGGFIADLTRSRAELVTENALLRQQLIVASRAVKRPAFRVHERGLLVLLASTSNLRHGRVEAAQFDPGVCRGEAPFDLAGRSRGVPRGDDRSKVGDAVDALVEALRRQGRQEDLGDVEPASVLGGVVHLESFDEAAGLAWFEGFVQARQVVDVEVVHHQNDDHRAPVDFVGKAAQVVSHVDSGASLGHVYKASPGQRFHCREEVGRAASLVFIVDPGRSAGGGGDGHPRVLEQLLAGLVETDLRPHGVIGSVVDLQDVLHGLHERSVFLGRNAEALYKPRLRLVFFRPRWTVLGLTESKTLSSTSRSARS